MALTHDERARIIRGCHVFSGQSEGSLAPLARASTVRTSGAGAQIFAAGDEPDGLRVVLSGQVRIWIADRDGRELTLDFLEPGDAFGEIALLDGLPRTASATAETGTECLFLPTAALQAALDADPALTRNLMLSLCELLRRNLGTINGFAFSGLAARLAGKLHHLALAHAEIEGRSARFVRRFSQTDLAQLLGVTREAVNKRLRVLERDGLLVRDGADLRIPDLDALAARAEAEERLSR